MPGPRPIDERQAHELLALAKRRARIEGIGPSDAEDAAADAVLAALSAPPHDRRAVLERNVHATARRLRRARGRHGEHHEIHHGHGGDPARAPSVLLATVSERARLVAQLVEEDYSLREVAELMGGSHTTAWRLLNELRRAM